MAALRIWVLCFGVPCMNESLRDRFRGCLVGLAVGDALGARFEAQSAEHIRGRFRATQQLMSSNKASKERRPLVKA